VIHLYVEGGGSTEAVKIRCRDAFRVFLEKLQVPDRSFRVIPCGSGGDAYVRFTIALSQPGDAFPMLLVDSEEPVQPGTTPWQHLAQRQEEPLARPPQATDDHAHLMVQCMEAWFLAQPNVLAEYYRPGFRPSLLPARQDIEAVPKERVLAALQEATRHCPGKDPYHKTKHGFELIARLHPTQVGNRSPHARRLFDVFLREINQQQRHHGRRTPRRGRR
jgi:hypothetical protein